jgi:hypothetical protein
MALLLPSILANSQRSPFLLLQSSSAQSCLQVLRSVINHRSHKNTSHLILLCFLHPSLSLPDETKQGRQIEVHDYTDNVPGYDDCGTDPRDDILLAVKAGEHADRSFHPSLSLTRSPPAPPGSLDIIIDSVDTLASDLGSPSQTYNFLFNLISLIRARPSKFILPNSPVILNCISHSSIHTDPARPLPLTPPPPSHSNLIFPVHNPYYITPTHPSNAFIHCILDSSSALFDAGEILGRFHPHQ